MTRKEKEKKSDKKLYYKILLANVLHSLFAALWWMIIIRWIVRVTCKSFSEAFILTSTNPQYDNRLFIELPVQ